MTWTVDATDIQSKIAPVESDYEVDISTVLTVDELASIVNIANDKVKSALPHKYRNALTHVDEVLTWCSKDGVLSYNTTLTPTVDTVKVYIDYPLNLLSFSLTNEDYETKLSWSITDKTITFNDPVPKGSSIFISYDHQDADSFYMLRDWVITLSSIEIAKRLYFHRDEVSRERFTEWQESYDTFVTQMHRGNIGVSLIDEMVLVNDPDTHSPIVENYYDSVLRW